MHEPTPTSIADTPVFILCGGLGTRIKEETEFRPKPMVPIGGKPILLHIMRSYAQYGFRRFILCLGFKAQVVKEYFLHYSTLNSNFSVSLSSNEVTVHDVDHSDDWEVTLVDTGLETMTGARIKRALSYMGDAPCAAVTYGDGLCNADLAAEYAFHLTHGRLGTVLGVNPPSRFGELCIEGNAVVQFDEKPEFREKWINGGYFFFQRAFFEHYLSDQPECVLERAPLCNLANDGQLCVYKHPGFWACMDTQRDRDHLEQMIDQGQTPWLNCQSQPFQQKALQTV